MIGEPVNCKENEPYNTRLHSKDFDLRFDKSTHALIKQSSVNVKQVKRSRKKKENREKKKAAKNKRECEHAQCGDCGEWYSNKIFSMHASQCRLLQEGLAIDINQKRTGESVQDAPLCFSRKIRVDVKCMNKEKEEGGSGDEVDGSSQSVDDAYQLHEKAWTMFEETASSEVHICIADIPFPPIHLDFNMLGLTNAASVQMKKARIREMLIKWHPDHFMQRFRSVIRVGDIPMVESMLNEVVRIISALKSTLPR